MFVSIVLTALILHFSFAALGITPESGRAVEDVVQFALDYTFWLNLLMVFVAAGMVALHLGHARGRSEGGSMDMGSDTWSRVKRRLAYLSAVVLLGGVLSYFLTG